MYSAINAAVRRRRDGRLLPDYARRRATRQTCWHAPVH